MWAGGRERAWWRRAATQARPPPPLENTTIYLVAMVMRHYLDNIAQGLSTSCFVLWCTYRILVCRTWHIQDKVARVIGPEVRPNRSRPLIFFLCAFPAELIPFSLTAAPGGRNPLRPVCWGIRAAPRSRSVWSILRIATTSEILHVHGVEEVGRGGGQRELRQCPVLIHNSA